MLVVRQFELLQSLLLDFELPQIRMYQLLLHHPPLLTRVVRSAVHVLFLLHRRPPPSLPEPLLHLLAMIDADDLRLSHQLVIVVEVY